MKKVIITGADGFVGSNTVEYFLSKNVEVLAIDIFEVPNRLKKHSLLTYMKFDVSKIDTLPNFIEKSDYDTFIHFAWKGSSGDQRFNYHLQMENVHDTLNCMITSKLFGCKRFICAGSIMEKEVIAAVSEQGAKPGLGYIYGMGKYMAHALCKSLAAKHEIDLIWPMITNAYGVGELSPRFINSTLRKIIKNEPLLFTSGVQNYDFVYINDVARAFYLISLHGKPFHEYVIGSSSAKPLKDFIIEMTEITKSTNLPIFGDLPFTGTNLHISVFDTMQTRIDTGFVAETSFTEGIMNTMKWLKTID